MELLTKLLINKYKNQSGGGPTPTGEIEITENGTYDVTSYASADVNIPATSDYNVQVKNPMTGLGTNVHFIYDIVKIKEINLANSVTSTRDMFTSFSGLTEVPLFDTSNITDMQSMFSNCSSLISVPLFNTSNVTRMNSMFSSCTSLTSVPLFDTSNVISMTSMFGLCPSLSDESLDNILQMCINAINYTSTKTLQTLNFNARNYPASRIQGLPHYQDFIDAGWTIGY